MLAITYNTYSLSTDTRFQNGNCAYRITGSIYNSGMGTVTNEIITSHSMACFHGRRVQKSNDQQTVET